MMRAMWSGLALLACAVSMPAGAHEAELTSRRDHSLNVNRDLPIVCKRGDIERVPGKSMGEVFGDAWPAQPEPSAPQAHAKARMTAVRFNASTNRGLPPQSGMVIAAVLVDAAGKALSVVPVCATDEGYDMATKRLLMRAVYRPATIDEQPITSVAIVIARYRNSVFLGEGEQ